jgi:predicted negative regulator of RcsB-dependent stress response
MHRETGDVVGQSIIRANLGFMALLLASLDEAQAHYEDGLQLARGAENKNLIATSLTGLGEVLLRRGDLAGARHRHEEALAMRSQMGEEKGAGESRMLLAGLTLEEGRARDAEAQLRGLPDAFRKVGAPEHEVHARAFHARALLAVGEVAAAQSEMRRARGLASPVIPPEVRFALAVAEGRVRAAAGDTAGATKSLEATAAEARAAGLKGYELEARLALAEVEMGSGRAEAGRARLRDIVSEARAKGLELLARQAAARAG